MDTKAYLINKINERLQAARRKEAEIIAHNKRFAIEVTKLTSAIREDLEGLPAVSIVQEPMVVTDSEPFAKLSITLFDKSVTLITTEQEGKLALQLDSFGFKAVIFKLDADGLWFSRQPSLNDLLFTNELIHTRLAKIVEMGT